MVIFHSYVSLPEGKYIVLSNFRLYLNHTSIDGRLNLMLHADVYSRISFGNQASSRTVRNWDLQSKHSSQTTVWPVLFSGKGWKRGVAFRATRLLSLPSGKLT